MNGVDAIYRLESVQQRFGDRVVLDVRSLDVRRGETLAIIGPSGAGKTTLLRLLQFLDRPAAGRVVFDGRTFDPDVPLEVRRKVVTVFQRPVVLDRSVRGNLEYGLRVRGRRLTDVRLKPEATTHRSKIRLNAAGTSDRVEPLLEALGLAALAGVNARSLSGGEMQRVAFARALAVDADVLLLDEPTANLDPRNVRLVEDLVRERQSRGVTVVLATHQIFQARRLAHRTALLLDGQVVEAGRTVDVLDRPSDPRTRAFLTGDMVY